MDWYTPTNSTTKSLSAFFDSAQARQHGCLHWHLTCIDLIIPVFLAVPSGLCYRFLEPWLSYPWHLAFLFLTLYQTHVFSAVYLFSWKGSISNTLLLILVIIMHPLLAWYIGSLVVTAPQRHACAVPFKVERRAPIAYLWPKLTGSIACANIVATRIFRW